MVSLGDGERLLPQWELGAVRQARFSGIELRGSGGSWILWLAQGAFTEACHRAYGCGVLQKAPAIDRLG